MSFTLDSDDEKEPFEALVRFFYYGAFDEKPPIFLLRVLSLAERIQCSSAIPVVCTMLEEEEKQQNFELEDVLYFFGLSESIRTMHPLETLFQNVLCTMLSNLENIFTPEKEVTLNLLMSLPLNAIVSLFRRGNEGNPMIQNEDVVLVLLNRWVVDGSGHMYSTTQLQDLKKCVYFNHLSFPIINSVLSAVSFLDLNEQTRQALLVYKSQKKELFYSDDPFADYDSDCVDSDCDSTSYCSFFCKEFGIIDDLDWTIKRICNNVVDFSSFTFPVVSKRTLRESFENSQAIMLSSLRMHVFAYTLICNVCIKNTGCIVTSIKGGVQLSKKQYIKVYAKVEVSFTIGNMETKKKKEMLNVPTKLSMEMAETMSFDNFIEHLGWNDDTGLNIDMKITKFF